MSNMHTHPNRASEKAFYIWWHWLTLLWAQFSNLTPICKLHCNLLIILLCVMPDAWFLIQGVTVELSESRLSQKVQLQPLPWFTMIRHQCTHHIPSALMRVIHPRECLPFRIFSGGECLS
jgi:hypothetical protein